MQQFEVVMNKLFLSFFFVLSSLHTFANEPYKTGVRILEFHDDSRDNKPVAVQIFYPVDSNAEAEPIKKGIFIRKEVARNAPISAKSNTYPLLLYSHGHGGSRADAAWLADELAPKGYIIASIEHEDELIQKIGAGVKGFWNRPLDISFILTKLLNHPEWKTKIDTNKIAASGFSKGGMAVTFLAGGQMEWPKIKSFIENVFLDKDEAAPYEINDFNSLNWSLVEKNYKDPRIKAFIAFAPSYGFQFTPKSLATIESPFLIMVGENDEIAPAESNAQYLNQHIKSSQYKPLTGKAGHFTFMNPCNQGGFIHAIGICKDDPSINRHQLHLQIVDQVDHFLKSTWIPHK